MILLTIIYYNSRVLNSYSKVRPDGSADALLANKAVDRARAAAT